MTHTTETLDAGEAFRFASNWARKWNRTNGDMLEPDEAVGIAGEVVARHLPRYDPAKSHRSCYAWLSVQVKFALIDAVRAERGRYEHARRTVVPYDPLSAKQADETGINGDQVALEVHRRLHEGDRVDEVIGTVATVEFVESLPQWYREIIEATMAGAKNHEMGRHWGVHGTRISQLRRIIRERYQESSAA